MNEKPLLSAKEMAEFAMRESHLDSTKRGILAHIEIVNGKDYAGEVRNLMIQIHKNRKGRK